ncbi:MAG: hypothetical protein QG559_1454 [Campylobacterota bacterium]|nr:hypothetical protein [Campylobacterota bacterium]
MKKLTISDAASFLGISKEAIHNRIRRGSLEVVVEDGVKLVVVRDEKKASIQETKNHKPAQVSGDRYSNFLEEQNARLQQKIDTLEQETRSLRDQKEQLLIEEKRKIEQIYRDKDEQLKNIINAISKKYMLQNPEYKEECKEEHIEAQIEDKNPLYDNRLISLKKYLKSQNLSKKEIKDIIDRFKSKVQTDSRIVTIGKKCYIDMQKYDYSDLLKY